ncbi:MAG: signal peptide peptidase SppA [Planctomycetes bacterium]|jgi:protease-4|nr:signal peptide peptidase SppA [Planctomycetota bacterium]
MDSERNDYEPSFPPDERRPERPPGAGPYPARRSFSGWRILWRIVFFLSVLANVGLFILLLSVIVMFFADGGGVYKAVIREGPRDTRIAVITIGGIIDGTEAEGVRRQIAAARQDRAVKGIILRVDSPGGTISASDRIHKTVLDYRRELGVPAVAFLQGMATSGGYYVSVACEKIVAEPTTITGSIGVVMMHFVFQNLLEDKLGIQPVFLTMGEKKDWPSAFRAPTQEELAYIQDRLLQPAYQRFVHVVTQGREGILSPTEVKKLADGSIYGAEQALQVKLVDGIGYLDEAIATVKNLAGIEAAQVVEYRKPFSLLGLLSAKSGAVPKLDRKTLFEFGTPQVLYLWNAY